MFDCKYQKDYNFLFLSVTHDGCRWTSIRIEKPLEEIPKLIGVLADALADELGLPEDGEGKS